MSYREENVKLIDILAELTPHVLKFIVIGVQFDIIN